MSRTVGLICKLRHFLPRRTLLTINLSIPCCSLFNLWFDWPKSHLEKLLKLQKRVLRLIYFSDRNQHAIPLLFDAGSRSSIQVNSFSRIGKKIWNEIPVSLRKLSKNAFKRKIKQTLFEILASEDCYIDLPEIVQKVKLNLFSS